MHRSRFEGYQAKKGENGTVKIFITSFNLENFDDFVDDFIWVMILERICLERAFQHIRMKDRCKPAFIDGIEMPCKMAVITMQMKKKLMDWN